MDKQILPQYIRQLINRLNEDELHALYRAVGEKLRLLHKAKALFSMREFQILDRVFFDYHGERKEGTITRLNQKTVSVTLDNGGHWNVSPDFLTKVDEGNPLAELPITTQEKARMGRNERCWCGSGKKYKKCHYPN